MDSRQGNPTTFFIPIVYALKSYGHTIQFSKSHFHHVQAPLLFALLNWIGSVCLFCVRAYMSSKWPRCFACQAAIATYSNRACEATWPRQKLSPALGRLTCAPTVGRASRAAREIITIAPARRGSPGRRVSRVNRRHHQGSRAGWCARVQTTVLARKWRMKAVGLLAGAWRPNIAWTI